MPTSTFRDHWSMCKAPQKLPAVTINANREWISWIFPYQDGVATIHTCDSRTPRCAQLVLVERVMFPKFTYVIGVSFHYYLFVPHPHFGVATCLSSILWRLAMCIARCWHTSLILSHVYTSLPYHVIPYERLERASTIYSGKSIEYMKYIFPRFEVTQQGLASLNNCPCLLCVL